MVSFSTHVSEAHVTTGLMIVLYNFTHTHVQCSITTVP
jgi:hypothetical protein